MVSKPELPLPAPAGWVAREWGWELRLQDIPQDTSQSPSHSPAVPTSHGGPPWSPFPGQMGQTWKGLSGQGAQLLAWLHLFLLAVSIKKVTVTAKQL